MWDIFALVSSFLAMALIAASYFCPNKIAYLLLQSLGMVFLMASYLFTGAFFALIGLGIGLCRGLTYFFFERQEKTAPVWTAWLFMVATLAAYAIVDLGIEQSAKPVDIFYLLSLIGFAFVMRERDLKTVRFGSIIPVALGVLYTVFSQAPVFSVLSYSFELGATILSILRYYVFNKEKTADGGQGEHYEKL
jgi:hypothetical protein